MRVPVLQLTVTIVTAAFAGFALLSGLDRLAAGDSATPAAIHWPYARNAPLRAAFAAANQHQSGAAAALMDQALSADPVNETLMGGLGQIRQFAGDAKGADAAFRVSAQRGWRDQATHFYWFKQSIEAADFNTAAIHADALLNAPLTPQERDQVFAALLEYDEGRNALAARLRKRPLWALGMALDIDHASPDQLAAQADVIARTGPGVWSCLDTAGLIDRLIDAGDMRDALAAHDATCAQSARQARLGNIVNDAHFIRYFTEPHASQLDWSAPDSADILINPASNAPAHGGAEITSTRGVTERVMAQRVGILPGTYSLTWQMPNTDPAALGNLVAGLGCDSDLARTAAGTAVPGKPGTFALSIRFAGDCPAPTLAFWLRPTSKPVTLDSVTLDRTGN